MTAIIKPSEQLQNNMFQCRLCTNKKHITILKIDKVYSLKKCTSCSFVSLQPLPKSKQLEQYYDKDYWQDGQATKNKFLNGLYRLRTSRLVKEIKKVTPARGQILDWGAGDGSLVKILNKEKFKCQGIDLYKTQPTNQPIINTTIEKSNFPDQYFDTITCFHVLEHLSHPLQSVKRALCLLKKGGLLIVEVPNIDALSFKIFKQKWQPLEIPTHLNHFNLNSLKRLFGLAGNNSITEVSFFSRRVSASSLVLSLFPSLSPKRVRQKHQGKYPTSLLLAYSSLQTLAYPLAAIESCLKRGAIIRLMVKKIK